MEQPDAFAVQGDYEVPLLRLLATLPGGQGKVEEVCRLFEIEYRDRIPASHLGTHASSKEPIWRNTLRWCRAGLKERGYIDPSLRGVWRITEAGRRWLEEHPGQERIPGSVSALVRIRRPTPIPRSQRATYPPNRRSARAPSIPGISLEMLEQTRKIMPPDQFRQVWGAVYDQLLLAERAKATTDITQTELGHRAWRRLDTIHAFLRGQAAGTPSGEALCGWIHFCYNLDLYREAAALWSYVREEEMEPGVYEQAKRIVEFCGTKEE